MNEFFLTGTLRAVPNRKDTSYTLSASNEQLLDCFLDYKQYAPKSTKDATWVVRRYLHHGEEKGYLALSELSCEEVKDFILKTAETVKVSSLHNILLYLKHFHEFLKENDIPAPDCVELFSHKV